MAVLKTYWSVAYLLDRLRLRAAAAEMSHISWRRPRSRDVVKLRHPSTGYLIILPAFVTRMN
jgi:hypothetical protein